MKTTNLKTQLALLLLPTLCLLTSPGAYAQITPLGDSYTSTADPTTNYGAQKTLNVDAAKEITYIQFNLASIPTGASISQATLKLYVNSVTTAGSFNVDYVNGTWAEETIDASNAPALGATIASNVAITTADKNQYILINITAAVQAWLNGSETNNGLALVANSTFSATFDSKESTTTSHPAELDIAFAGGDGTITGVTTASGSGLTGGGTSGTLNLALTNTCAANQVLQWNGTSWICAAVGTGTITGVTAGTDLTGGGTSGNVTLNLNTTALNSTYAQLAAANTFTGNQTVSGNLSATGAVTGSSFNIGSNAFAFGSYTNGNVFLGFSGNTTMTAYFDTATGYQAFYSNTTGNENTASGATALYSNTTGASNTATGVGALSSNTSGSINTASGFGALGSSTTGGSNTASGAAALSSNTTGSSNTASGSSALSKNTTGGQNTAVGYFSGLTIDSSNMTANNNTFLGALAEASTGTLTNVTAIGSYSSVSESNALVLGCVSGQNRCPAAVNVGIGTTAPSATLDVYDSGSGFAATISSTSSAANNAVQGKNTATSGYANGGLFITSSPQGSGIVAQNTGTGGDDYAAYLVGNVVIFGNLAVNGDVSKNGGSFKIDHPLDPANKYLYHSFVESPDMMNVYNGNVVTNQRGLATVTLPDYFESLNRDFRYQLTVIGQFAQAIVAREVSGNRFTIKTNKPGVKVSWQVTGIRHDAYADANRIKVEVEKPPQEHGRYLHPELFGAPAEQAIGYLAPPMPTQPPAPDGTAHVSSLKAPPASLK
jgi:trimeric autotransporter adhesin